MRTKTWDQPRRWNKLASVEAVEGKTWAGRRGFWPVFCASLADVFDNEVDPKWQWDLWKLIEETPNLTWQLVTKRIGNADRMVPASWMLKGFPSHVWMIATMVNQEEIDRDWEKLRRLPARVRGLSVEPMLGPVNLPREGLHWAIFGGESHQPTGRARVCDLRWIENGVAQCRALGISPFVKQLGSTVRFSYALGIVQDYGSRKRADPALWPEALRVQEFPA